MGLNPHVDNCRPLAIKGVQCHPKMLTVGITTKNGRNIDFSTNFNGFWLTLVTFFQLHKTKHMTKGCQS